MNQDEILDTLTSYWTDRAQSYSAQNIAEMNDWRRQAWRELILSHAPQKECLRVLDIGTGPGFFAINLALAGHEVTAVDVTGEMLAHAKQNAESYGAKAKFVLHRGEFLPFEDNSFDLIVSRNVVWNLEYPEQALSEWARVLAPGGRMVYFDANWYRYLYDEEMRKGYEADRAATAAEQVRDEYVNTDIEAMEEIARNVPLSRELRPQWDEQILQQTGFGTIDIDTDIWQKLWTEDEKINYASTPMFRIAARRGISE